jgi:hypothetical protein
VCPAVAAPALRVTTNQVQADHCVALTPASSACPAAPASAVSVASSRGETDLQGNGAALKVSRN